MAVFSGNGSNGSPSFTFSSDTDTGFYRYDADKIGVATAGTLRAIFDASGRFLVNTTAQFITAGELISAGGTIVAQNNSTTISPFYSSNNASDAGGVPFYSMHDGSANRGGLFLDSSSIVKLSGQNGVDLATSTAAPAPTKVRIDSTGAMLIGGTIPSSPNASITASGIVNGELGRFGPQTQTRQHITSGRIDVAPGVTKTVQIAGVQNGIAEFRGGGYISGGKGYWHISFEAGGYMTTTSFYNLAVTADAVGGAQAAKTSPTKNNTYVEFTLTNNDATTTGVFQYMFRYAGSTATVTVT